MRLHQAMACGLFAWAGLLVGVSFVATPSKFLAPTLSLPQALDVGRVTFAVLAAIEWSLLVAFAALLIAGWNSNGARRTLLIFLLAVAAILAVETFALRPALDARVASVMAGGDLPPSQLHRAYVALEVLKLLVLLAAGVVQGRQSSAA